MELDVKLLFEISVAIAGVVGVWAVMKSQVADLRTVVEKQDKQISVLELEQARLGERHAGFGEKLDGALVKLESVTGQLQNIAIQIARGANKT